ncbi:MAG TPA: hypothetical protein VI653_10775 [Steroidobacteraceae bacterium]
MAHDAGRQLNLSAALLALSVLADSAVEHYRGSFNNRAMYIPLASAAGALAASVYGALDKGGGRHRGRDILYGLSAATGLAGLAFHTYNITKRPGGFSWLNLFYAAPIGAPAALVLAGLLGRGAEKTRALSKPGAKALAKTIPAAASARPSRGAPSSQDVGRLVAAVSSLGLFGTTAEAALLHFRGAFQNPAMVLPVTLPPVAGALIGSAAIAPRRAPRRLTRLWLRLTAMLGFAGVGFHAYGVSRAMGGWRNWSQNLLNGPPLPAPPSFTGLALAGLAALGLIEGPKDA